MTRLRRHLRENLVAWIALFVALGGTGAYAANTIGSADIIDESIQSVDIKNGQVSWPDIKPESIGTARVANHSLTGDDVKNGSLGGADLAGGTITAANLATLDRLRLASNTDGTKRLTFGNGGLSLREEKPGWSILRLNGTLAVERGLSFGLAGVGQTQTQVLSAYFEDREALQLVELTQVAENSWSRRPVAKVFGSGARHRVGSSGEPGFTASQGCASWGHFSNGTSGFAEFRMTDDETTHLSGLVSGGSVNCTIFTLPTRFAPCVRQIVPVVSNNAFGRLTIETDGRVIAGAGTSSTWISLNGVTFQNRSLFC